MSCECLICKDIARWEAGLASDNKEDRRKVFEEMFERLEAAETDATYYRGILKGEWPSAEQILEHALERVKEQNKAQEDLISTQKKLGIIE